MVGDPARTGWLREWRYAHRGLHGPGAPENSLAAARGAIARGLGIECDIQLSADGQAMVFHDWELDRLTEAGGPFRSRTAAELAAIPLTGGAEPAPRLADLLGLVAGRVPLLIEVKSRRAIPVGPICAAIAGDLAGYGGRCAVMSFDPRVGRWFAAHAPQTVRGLVATEENARGLWGRVRRELAFRAARAEFLAYDIRDLPSPFAAARRAAGAPVLSWTVRSAELAALAAIHADAPIAEGEGLA